MFTSSSRNSFRAKLATSSGRTESCAMWLVRSMVAGSTVIEQKPSNGTALRRILPASSKKSAAPSPRADSSSTSRCTRSCRLAAMARFSPVDGRSKTPDCWDRRRGSRVVRSASSAREVHMSRKMFDCREWPGKCTLAILGEQEEVVEAQPAARRARARAAGDARAPRADPRVSEGRAGRRVGDGQREPARARAAHGHGRG